MNKNKEPRLIFIFILTVIASLFCTIDYHQVIGGSLNEIGLDSANSITMSQLERSQDLFNKVKNSVVRIDTLVQYVNPRITVDNEPFLNEPTGFIGSGFVYDEGGKIITNYHVIQDAQAILVKFMNGNGYRATVVGVEPLIDLAVLQLDPSSIYKEKLEPLPLGDPSQIQVGIPVVAIGSPVGLTGSMTEGIVSQVNRIQKSLLFPDSWVGDLIQTDAPINHGNSGGPLLNLNGEVVGVNDRGILSDENSLSTEPNIGLAISSGTVKKVVDHIIANGSFVNPYLGVAISDIPPFFPEKVGLTEAKGAYVLSVIPDGPASRAQVESNNVIVKADEIFIRDKADLINYIQGKSPADAVALTIVDNRGVTNIHDIVLGSMPPEFGGE